MISGQQPVRFQFHAIGAYDADHALDVGLVKVGQVRRLLQQ